MELLLPSLLQTIKASVNPIWLASWAQDGSFTYKGLGDSHRSISMEKTGFISFMFEEIKEIT